MSVWLGSKGKNIMQTLKHLARLGVVVTVFVGSVFAQHVVLNWTAPATPTCGPLTGYKVYRATASGMQDFTKPLASLALVTTYTDATVSFGITYYYKVTALDGTPCGNGESHPSNEAVAAVPVQIIIVQPNPPALSQPQVVIP